MLKFAYLNDIERVVSEGGEASGTHSTKKSHKGGEVLFTIVGDDALVFVEPHESKTLVGSLLQSGGNRPLIDTPDTLAAKNVGEAVGEAHVELDALGLDSLHGGNDHKGLGDSGSETSHKILCGSQFAFRIPEVVLDHRVQTESNSGLRDRSQQSGGQTTVERQEARRANGVGEPLNHSAVGQLRSLRFRLELQLGLDEFHGPDSCGFNASSDAAGRHGQERVFLLVGRHDKVEKKSGNADF